MSSDEEDVVVGSKRQGTRQTRSSNKRLQILDDEDQDAGDQIANPETLSGDVVKNRLLDRLKKTSERTRENNLRTEQKTRQKNEALKVKAAAAAAAIPKKAVVPRRSDEESPGTSLLAGMLVPLPASTAGKTGDKSRSSSSKDQLMKSPKSAASVRNSANPPKDVLNTRQGFSGGEAPTIKSRPPSSSNSLDLMAERTPPIVILDTSSVGGGDVLSKASSRPISATDVSKRKVLHGRVWESLTELCHKMSELENRPFRLGPAGALSSLDLSASFLRQEREYDWFDLDGDGNIVLQPKVPIFPEDFPPGMPEWPLSWWGIVDPAVGERKDVVLTALDNELAAKPVDPTPLQLQPDRNDRKDHSRSRDQRDRSSLEHAQESTRTSSSRSRDRHYDYHGSGDRESRRSRHRSGDRSSRSGSRDRGSDHPSVRSRSAHPHDKPGGQPPGGMDPYGPPPPMHDDRRRPDGDRRSGRDRVRYPAEMPPPPRDIDRPRYLDNERNARGGPPPPSFRGEFDRERQQVGGGRQSDDGRRPRHADESRRDDRGGRDRGPR